AITLTDTLPSGMTVNSLSGTGWICNAATVTCTRSDSLGVGLPYPQVTLVVNVSGSVVSPATNLVNVSGGGSVPASAADGTLVNNGPPSPLLLSPANGATGISIQPTLQWTSSAGATSYDVYLSTSNPPAFVANVTTTSYIPALLIANQTYQWQVIAKN